MIQKKPYYSLITHTGNGSGKTAALAIGSSLRVERTLKKT
jgi:hypothetical protein